MPNCLQKKVGSLLIVLSNKFIHGNYLRKYVLYDPIQKLHCNYSHIILRIFQMDFTIEIERPTETSEKCKVVDVFNRLTDSKPLFFQTISIQLLETTSYKKIIQYIYSWLREWHLMNQNYCSISYPAK